MNYFINDVSWCIPPTDIIADVSPFGKMYIVLIIMFFLMQSAQLPIFLNFLWYFSPIVSVIGAHSVFSSPTSHPVVNGKKSLPKAVICSIIIY